MTRGISKILSSAAIATIIALACAPHTRAQTCCRAAANNGTPCRDTLCCDSVNIPVFIVDGVEVLDISGLPTDDIVKIEVIKDPAVTRLFSPRLGGVVAITTRSKKYLKPILEQNAQLTEQQKKERIPGQLLIR